MMDSKEISSKFLAELSALLKKWDAELTAEDNWAGYPECGQDIRMQVTIPSKYDKNDNVIREYTSIDLGSSWE